MDVFFETPSGSLAEDLWSASEGWQNQVLPGGSDVASSPSAIDRGPNSMDVFFETPSGSLAEDYWTSTGGWVNQALPGGTDVGSNSSVITRDSDSMDVFFRTPSGSLAEDYWTSTGGWINQALPGGNDVGSNPSAITRDSDSMDVYFETPGGSLAEDYWTSTGSWVNQGLPGGTDVASGPAAITRDSDSMDVYFETPSGLLAEDYWTSTGGWVNQGLGSQYSPEFTSATSAVFAVGVSNTFLVTSTGDPTVTFSEAGALPSGVTFVDNGNDTATLSGSPTASTAGTYFLTLDASNSVSNATQYFTLTVDQPPTISSADQATFTVGAPNSFTVTTSAGFPTPSLSESGGIPSGIAFTDNGDGTAALAGIPATGSAGTYPITITASNGIAPDAIQDFTLTVLSIGITTSSLPGGSVYSKANKVTYSATLAASGGNPPYKWSLVSGSALPPGLKLSSKGVISGKATTTGTYSFTVQAVDTKTKAKPHTQNKAAETLSITIS
jgi:hypothetical protein